MLDFAAVLFGAALELLVGLFSRHHHYAKAIFGSAFLAGIVLGLLAKLLFGGKRKNMFQPNPREGVVFWAVAVVVFAAGITAGFAANYDYHESLGKYPRMNDLIEALGLRDASGGGK